MITAIYTEYFDEAKDLAIELRQKLNELQRLTKKLEDEADHLPFETSAREEYEVFADQIDDAAGWLENACDVIEQALPFQINKESTK